MFTVFITLAVTALGTSEVRAQANLRDIFWQKANANTSFEDSCKGKDYCLVVVVAPWCAYCKNSLPMIRALQSKAASSQTFGLRIVISGDRADALENEARILGVDTFIDPNENVLHAGGFGGYPTWASLDADQNVLRSRSGAYSDPTRCDDLLTALGISL